jgi:hypothetical protein
LINFASELVLSLSLPNLIKEVYGAPLLSVGLPSAAKSL